jgi:hypothetical protein
VRGLLFLPKPLCAFPPAIAFGTASICQQTRIERAQMSARCHAPKPNLDHRADNRRERAPAWNFYTPLLGYCHALLCVPARS